MKDTNLTLIQHGLVSGALLKVQKGEARMEGQYAIDVVFVWLQQEEEREKLQEEQNKDEDKKQNMKEADKEEQFIGKRKLGTLTVETGTTIAKFKQEIFETLIVEKGLAEELKIQGVHDMRLRNAKNNDLGPICKEKTNDGEDCLVHEHGLWDNKEFYVQCTEHPHQLYQAFEGGTYNILVREFKGDTWEFGPIYEIQVEKMITYKKLGEFLHNSVFGHIPQERIWGARVKLGEKAFIRSDLAQKRWTSLTLN